MDDNELRSLAELLTGTALRAGQVTLRYFKSDAANVTQKADGSPVTLADHEAEELILEDLRKYAADIPVVAEEAVSRGEIPAVGHRFFLVDPLDGTREFTGGSGEFTVNIGLVEDGEPVFGIVYAPALGDIYITLGGGEAAMAKVAQPSEPGAAGFAALALQNIATRPVPEDGLTVVASRSHGTSEGNPGWRACLCRSRPAATSGRPSSSVWWRGVKRTSIRVMDRRWSGIRLRGMPCCGRQAVSLRPLMAHPSGTARRAPVTVTPGSSPIRRTH